MPTITIDQAKRRGLPEHTLQTIEVPLTFTLNKAREWLKHNGYDWITYRTTPHFRRFIQVNPIQGATYHSKKLDNGIILVFQTFNA